MKIRAYFLVVLALASFRYAQAEGFQGLLWGSSIASINKKFPEARQDAPSTDMYADCKNPDGTTYKCSVAQSTCAKFGLRCYPPLKVKDYRVGNYPFGLVFELSKTKGLNEVSLTFSGNLIGQTTQHGKVIYESLLDSLEIKYGKPSVSEPYDKMSVNGMYGAYGFYQWRIDGNRIGLILSGRFDPTTQRFIDVGGAPSITIIYSPLIDDAASRL